MSAPTIADRLANIYTWLREPDFTEEASLEWLMDWMNRRPIAELAMVAMLMPDTLTAQSPAQVHPIENADAGQSFRGAYLSGKIER
jgi:hypothetical protein